MKRIVFVVALIAGSTFVTAGASAQSQVKATVPFEFNVNGSVVPAGTYMISANNIGQDVLNISSWEKKVHLLVTGDSNWGDQGKDNVLLFHKVGDQYFLSEIRCTDSAMSIYFPPSKAEQKAETQTVHAGIPLSTDVMVDLN